MSAVHPAAALAESRVRIGALASRAEAADALFLAAATALGLYGFRATYGDLRFLGAGIGGLLLGIAIGHVSLRLRLPAAAAVAIATGAFFVLGGVVVGTTALGGFIPTLATLRTLVHSSVHGWRDLITLLPPVGSAGPLLVIPYLLGIVAGLGGYLLARRTRSAFAPTAAPGAVLVASILFGTPQPASLLLQGAAFAAVCLGWAGVRQRRGSLVTEGDSRGRWSAGAGVGMLAAAAACGMLLAPHLPFSHAHQRVILRDHVQPPFDPSAYPSALGGFRNYVSPRALRNRTLLVVSGLPRGARLQLATMDAYDGFVWGVTNGTTGSGGAFERVGSRIPQAARGTHAAVRVTIRALRGIWVPTAGEASSIRFQGRHARSLADGFRYDLETGTAVDRVGLHAGDTYVVDAVVAPPPQAGVLRRASAAGTAQPLDGVPPQIADKARQWSRTDDPSAYAALTTLATRLRNGAYSDGGVESKPGHGEWRMNEFLKAPQLVGDDEQYASAFALLANALGYPTRVVLGAIPEADGAVRGIDVHAWAEVHLTGAGWVPFDVTPPKDRHPDPNPPLISTVNRTPNRVPPAAPEPPPASDSSADTSSGTPGGKKHATKHRTPVPVLPAVEAVARAAAAPAGAIAAILSAIAGAKLLRRRLRRRRGTPAERVSAGWRELVDLAADLGLSLPSGDTRRATSLASGSRELAVMANAADAATFGPADPDDDVAAQYWSLVDETRRRLLSAVSRSRRLAATFSLTSLSGPRLARRLERLPELDAR